MHQSWLNEEMQLGCEIFIVARGGVSSIGSVALSSIMTLTSSGGFKYLLSSYGII